MERSCDFCVGLRPVVFCEADAAHLCFPCDSKVHSANALSKRHPRILICESCRNYPAYARCADHQKFMCQGCDQIHHDLSSEHKKKIISTYTGCPSVKELAEAWGFDPSDLERCGLFVSPLNMNVEGDNMNVIRQFKSQNRCSSVVSSTESLRSSVSEEYEVGSGNSHIRGNKRGQQYNNSVCFQQVPNSRKLQLTEGIFRFSKGDQVQDNATFYIDSTDWKMSGNDDRHDDRGHPDFQLEGNLDGGLASKPYPSLADILNGDSVWQSKSSVQSNQLWSQNMQDLGVCDELRSMDDFSMPDVDLTFQNYEELFKGDEEPTAAQIDDKISTRFDPSIDVTHSQENPCNSTESEGIPGIQFDSGDTFIGHEDKKCSRHDTEAGYTSYRKVKSVSMKRVKSKGSNAEGSHPRMQMM